MIIYYVYALIDPKTNEPFYIGKGSGNRVKKHEKGQDGCFNSKKDKVIEAILREHETVPYIILKYFENEEDAYEFEKEKIEEIGIKNLTNICYDRRPPSQKGISRSDETIEKIRKNSLTQGKERTIQHVLENRQVFFEVLNDIQNKVRRKNTMDRIEVTVDLYNKISANFDKYVDILTEHTDLKIKPRKKPEKINGMKLKVFDDKKHILLEMFRLIDEGYQRKDIVDILKIHVGFYDRYKKRKEEFMIFLEN